MPTVPGPRESDRMLIMEKAPLIIPKPSPATVETATKVDHHDIQNHSLPLYTKFTVIHTTQKHAVFYCIQHFSNQHSDETC